MNEKGVEKVHISLPLRRDIENYNLQYVDSDGVIKCTNSDYLLNIPFQKTYCLLPHSAVQYDILKCDDATDSVIKLNYPYGIAIKNVRIESVEGDQLTIGKEEYDKLQENFPNTCVWRTSVFSTPHSVYYFEKDKLTKLFSSTKECKVVILSYNYMLIYDEIYDKFSGNIYWYSGQNGNITPLCNFTSSLDVCRYHIDDDRDNDIMFYAFSKKHDKGNIMFYAVFSNYADISKDFDSFTGDGIVSKAPNDIFSDNDRYEIRDISELIIDHDKNNSVLKLMNAYGKINIVMLDGRLLFNKWVDSFRDDLYNEDEVLITYTDKDGNYRTENISKEDFIEAIENCDGWYLKYCELDY